MLTVSPEEQGVRKSEHPKMTMAMLITLGYIAYTVPEAPGLHET